MTFVICLLVLSSDFGREPLEVFGRLISSDRETWLIDIRPYVRKNPRFKDNLLVQSVDSNNCRIVK